MKLIKTMLLALLLALLSPFSGTAGDTSADADAGDQFNLANTAYSQGDFNIAVTMYEELIAGHGYAPGLLYNLANSYVLLGQPGRAVLNYERARLLAPANPDIASNLTQLKHDQGLFDEEPSGWARITDLLTLGQWSLLGLSGGGLLLATAIFPLFRGGTLRVAAPIFICSLAAIVLSAAAGHTLYEKWSGVVVLSPKARLIVSPFDGAASIGEVQEGRIVYPLGEEHNGYVRVREVTGRKGWIPKAHTEPLIP